MAIASAAVDSAEAAVFVADVPAPTNRSFLSGVPVGYPRL
jgi:hypothetical protein